MTNNARCSSSSFEEEEHRPSVHYTAADTWINDPNGLVYADGTYHLFFQNNPFGTEHAYMSWGHAVSEDLHHWRDEPLAIPFEQGEQIFSGSAVVDEGNTAGFGEPGTSPLVAIYTSHYEAPSERAGLESQSLAYSIDGGHSWTKYEGNPVLDRESADFRDPKVLRYSGPVGTYWVMVAVEAVDRKVVLYRSDNLREWSYLSEFASAEPDVEIWECPDLFPVPVDGDPGTEVWVLVVNFNREPGHGGSSGVYFLGDFDGTSFSQSAVDGSTLGEGGAAYGWLDYGRDFYAAVSFYGDREGRRVLIGWMNNWEYARILPTRPWRGSMTLPRELRVRREANGLLTVRQLPVPGLRTAGPTSSVESRTVTAGSTRLGVEAGTAPCRLDATFASGTSTAFGLVVREGPAEGTRIGYEIADGTLVVDRTASGATDFNELFPSVERVPLALDNDGRLRLEVYLDAASVEVFAQDGLAVVSDQVFPDPSSTGISLYAVGGEAELHEFTLTPLAPAGVVRLPAPQPSAAAG